uniref:Lysosomal membrane ascorbate-dependent ferrireductase CYB561A3 n=1 Tax=Cyprinus carpio TaxID=7962 RepID=A0A8C2C1M4_CYPCA
KIWACGMFEHLCLMFVCLWSGIWRGGFAWDKSFLQFNWHPVLMVTSLVMLYGNAMVLYRVPLKWSRWWCKLTHAGLLFVAVLLSVLGVYAAFHTANNIPHLYLLHSWTGTSTVALFTLQVYINYSMSMLKNIFKYIKMETVISKCNNILQYYYFMLNIIKLYIVIKEKWRCRGLNPGPHTCKACALPLSYIPFRSNVE